MLRFEKKLPGTTTEPGAGRLIHETALFFAKKKPDTLRRRARAVLVPGGYLLKFALTDRLAFMATAHVAVLPEQAPDQPAKALPAGGVAVSVTVVPGA